MAAETLNFKKISKVIGIKQSIKAVEKGMVLQVYLARDADVRILVPLQQVCETQNVPIIEGCSMEMLGAACGIDVGAAAVAILK